MNFNSLLTVISLGNNLLATLTPQFAGTITISQHLLGYRNHERQELKHFLKEVVLSPKA